MINGGGTKVKEFEILGLTSEQLVLVYPGSAAPGACETFGGFRNSSYLCSKVEQEMKREMGILCCIRCIYPSFLGMGFIWK